LTQSEEHLFLIRRFPGSTPAEQAFEFSRLLYRCVRIHCGKQVSEADALAAISAWVASCLSNAPIVAFESPVLSSCAVAGESTTPSSQNSFATLSSMDSSFISDHQDSDHQDTDVLTAANFLGWCPGEDDI
jgi:hypothetical protein